MLMPATLTENLMSYGSASTDQQLLQLLQSNINDYAHFFIFACDDENWRSMHSEFISESLKWFTDQFLANTISASIAGEVVDSIKHHYFGLKPLLPLNVNFMAIDGQLPINSLMYQASSPFFQHLIHKSCYGKSGKNLYISGMQLSEVKIVDEYVYTNEVHELWKLSDRQLKRMLDVSFKFDLPGLAELCQILLWRRLEPLLVYGSLITSHENSWEFLREKCGEIINASDAGIEISFPNRYSVSCYLESITERSLESFRKVMPIITHLIYGSRIADEKGFHRLLQECPKLISVDLGRTENYSYHFEQLPEQVNEVIFSGCSWLNDSNFKAIIVHCPSVRSLDLMGCTTLTAMGWGELLNLPNLKRLNISNCSVIVDKELSVILDAATDLIELNLDGCDQISESGFQQLSQGKRMLEVLSMARTNATDASVILIAEQQRGLSKLNISSCHHITEAAVVETLKIAKNLRELNCTACSISFTLLEDLRKQYPNVQIL
ncbi:MAG: BTB/POZ domain-containing protein [Parachlamydiaceae bacterium]|nr:BTB/POZ domain-containing protein [Parachlamydiaceae bacterium]